MKKNKFPKGWDEEKIKKVLTHYENQTEDEALIEDDAAYEDRTQTTIEIPVQLVPVVRQLIAKHQTLHPIKTTATHK